MSELVHYAIPAFILLLLLEVAFSVYEKKDWFEARDTFSSLAMGIGSVLIGLLTKAFLLGGLYLAWSFRPWDLGFAWWVWALGFFAEDLSYYWFHRVSHGSRFFWASHVVHHSSQRYNLGTALRQTWTGELTGTFVFWLWMPLAGFHPLIILTLKSVSLLYQFWIHTEAIYRLPRPIEWFFNTPSHHRVHHGSDPIYLDRNHGGILIIWDRLFGTFQAEQHHPAYGLTTNIKTYNPVKIALHEWMDMGKDLMKSRSVKEFIGYLFREPGWSPDGSRKTSQELRREWESLNQI
jgi:sterol desaturase/sphingolipid hydroxylase (fatty acid hydroxylase superfamily)